MRRLQQWLQHPAARYLLAIFFCTAGVLHFVFPAAYIGVMPPWLPAHAELVFISGVAEVAGGVGILWALTRPAAGWGLLLLCIAVLPANVQMWLDAVAAHKTLWLEAVLLLRLPLQLPLMLWIWCVMRQR